MHNYFVTSYTLTIVHLILIVLRLPLKLMLCSCSKPVEISCQSNKSHDDHLHK